MRSFRRTSLLTVFCISILVGLVLARKIYISSSELILASLPLALLISRRNIASLFAIVSLGLMLGIIRGDSFFTKLSSVNSYAGKSVVLKAVAINDAVYGQKSQIEFNASNLIINGKHFPGKAKISGFGVPMVYRGDAVLMHGKLYPSRGANQVRMSFATIEIIGYGNDYFAKISRMFSAGIENSLPEPQASFALGLLVGQRTNLPENVINGLTAVGLIHIVAVSGYNLTILTRAAQKIKMGSKYQRLLVSMVLILSFLLITGTSASIVRAAIVSALSLIAWFYGRTFKPTLLLSLTAAITAFYSPFYIWSDIGWYLSFLAFFGVLVIAPLIQQKLKLKQKVLTGVLIETISAEIMTLPLIIYIFGQLSIISLIANILVVPLVPVAMLLSALAATVGVLIPAYASWFSWPANILLTYILDLVNVLSSIPKVLLKVNINETVMISIYAIVLVAMAKFYKTSKKLKTS